MPQGKQRKEAARDGKEREGMRATVLTDNIRTKELAGEWGLSIWIEAQGRKLLLDTGASGLFLENAGKLQIPIKEADFAVLSHAHYDHANGMRHFFAENDHAPFYVRDTTAENCYLKKGILKHYIGIPKGILKKYEGRFRTVEGDCALAEGIYLIPHKTEGLESIGRREHMYRKMKGHHYVADDFSHEQSLVVDTPEGLVILNSCSHGGADNIITEVSHTFPEKKIRALIGGFHLFNKSEVEIRDLAERIRSTGISRVYTGHCTGKRAYDILRETLGDQLQQLSVGMVIEL